ncbi:MAG: hypothetical protein ACD_69C00157G0002 [uncultured bacterium]|nr:MAG: hypothetical protein ACD_69C00157G0002 [uncultured bacterium]
MLLGVAREIAIVDSNVQKASGESLDLNHGISFVNPTSIYQADYKDGCQNADVIVITAGAAQKEGETRLDLIKTNTKIFKSIISEIVKYAKKEAILLVVTNPVDVLTYVTYKLSGFPSNQVIGSGTVLDTSRLRFLISQHFQGINAKNIHAYIIGEHGDTEFPVWSNAQIGGVTLEKYLKSCSNKNSKPYKEIETELKSIHEDVKNSAYKIIAAKGSTYYAIALSICSIIKAIVRNEQTIMPVSTFIDDYYGVKDIYLSLPSLVGQNGVEYFLRLDLSPEEQKLFKKSAQTVKKIIEENRQ